MKLFRVFICVAVVCTQAAIAIDNNSFSDTHNDAYRENQSGQPTPTTVKPITPAPSSGGVVPSATRVSCSIKPRSTPTQSPGNEHPTLTPMPTSVSPSNSPAPSSSSIEPSSTPTNSPGNEDPTLTPKPTSVTPSNSPAPSSSSIEPSSTPSQTPGNEDPTLTPKTTSVSPSSSPVPSSGSVVTSSAQATSSNKIRSAAIRLFRLHNEKRREYGNDVQFTCLSKSLTKIAENHSFYQIKNGFSAHDVPGSLFDDRCARIPFRSGCAENLAGGRPILEPENMMSNWMNSDYHRPAITKAKYDTVGFGIVQDPQTKKYWTTAFFARGGRTANPADCINLNGDA